MGLWDDVTDAAGDVRDSADETIGDAADWVVRSDEPAQSTYITDVPQDTLADYYEENPDAQEDYSVQPGDLFEQDSTGYQTIDLGDDGGTEQHDVDVEGAANDAADALSGSIDEMFSVDVGGVELRWWLLAAGVLGVAWVGSPYVEAANTVAGGR